MTKAKEALAADETQNVLDLQQVPLATGLKITVENPVILLKDRPYLSGHILLDLGMIKVTNSVENVKGRWKSNPEATVYENQMLIEAQSIRIDFQKEYFE